MDPLNDPTRAALIQQIRNPETLSEVRAALSALRRWRQQYPQDWGILDAGEELSLLEDALLEDDAPLGQLFRSERDRLNYQAMGAQTLPEVYAARHALSEWVESHPEKAQDDLMQGLFLLLDVVEEREGGTMLAEKQETRELVGQSGKGA